MEIDKALSDKFGLEYLKSCVEQEIQKVAEREGETKLDVLDRFLRKVFVTE